MALSVHSAQTSQRGALVRNLVFTLLLGGAFLGIKSYEYYHKFAEHLVPGRNFVLPVSHGGQTESNDNRSPPPTMLRGEASSPMELFFSLYFLMTGLHAVHMVIGVAVLLVLIVAASRGVFSAGYFTPVEMSGLYWHFVDIVWVFLFPLLYLIR
jgi:cytochrome c oxidase subunit 3